MYFEFSLDPRDIGSYFGGVDLKRGNIRSLLHNHCQQSSKYSSEYAYCYWEKF